MYINNPNNKIALVRGVLIFKLSCIHIFKL